MLSASTTEIITGFFTGMINSATSTLADLVGIIPVYLKIGIPVVVIVGITFWFFGLFPFTGKRRTH